MDPFTIPVGQPIHAFYAGYLNISLVKAFYYVYTPSLLNPSKDPLVVVISPGPGCSELYDFLYSKGEFIFVKNTTLFRLNDHNWNK